MTFRVGQKVVCVDSEAHARYTPWAHSTKMDGLKKGRVYTIRRIGFYCGEPCIWLCEIVRKIPYGWQHIGEAGYSPNRFRPIVERKTDISIFKKMLNPQEVDA